MAKSFYAPGNQRAARVQDLFARVAPHYDLLNDLQSFGFHRYWKRLVVRMARPRPNERALDLCCGTGDISFALTVFEAQVVGLDFSGAMLERAQARAQPLVSSVPARRLPQFVRADAQHLPFDDNSFDIVTVGYGLRNLSSWENGLREMQRVAKPGGRLLVLEFGKPENPFWRALYLGYLRFFVPLLGRIFCGDTSAYAYILESLTHYRGQQAVAAKMRDLGLRQVRLVNLIGGAMSINYGEK